jgi:bifunctional ADP-heptose synthase (sugar kinase/adenylyltransferase)
MASDPAHSIDAAARFAEQVQARGGTVVFTNGVFDLLHPGHVRANKGPERPITPETERAEILLAFECVDAVAIFDEDTPAEIVKRIHPDVLVKGADWAADNIVGRDTVEASGGRVVRIPLLEGYSTTELLRRVRKSR